MKQISPSDFVKLAAGGSTVVIDVRGRDEYALSHFPGSKNIPLSELPSRLGEIPRDRLICLICQSGMRSGMACQELMARGFSNVKNVEGGLNRVASCAGPAVAKKRSLPIMQQVQVAAGALVLLGVLLSKWLAPGWIFLSGFVGIGLIGAGLTGYCGMAMLLAKMPWNRNASSAGCG